MSVPLHELMAARGAFEHSLQDNGGIARDCVHMERALAAAAEARARTHVRVLYLEAALNRIAKCEGRFSGDRLTHATNTIADMAKVATDALAGTWEANDD